MYLHQLYRLDLHLHLFLCLYLEFLVKLLPCQLVRNLACENFVCRLSVSEMFLFEVKFMHSSFKLTTV